MASVLRLIRTVAFVFLVTALGFTLLTLCLLGTIGAIMAGQLKIAAVVVGAGILICSVTVLIGIRLRGKALPANKGEDTSP